MSEPANRLRVPSTTNPFELEPLSFSWVDKVKMAFVGITLFPARVAVFVSSVVSIVSISVIATLGHDESQPLPPWRRALLQPIRPFARAMLWSMGFWRIKVTYMPGSAPGGAGVLAGAPHYSLIDPLVLAWLELPCSVSKKAVRDLPLVGRTAAALQCIFVDRKDPLSKKVTAQAIVERARSAAWPPVLVFPEGTCTNGRCLISFKAGAFLPGVPVQPIALRYTPGAHGLPLAACRDDAELRLLLAMLQIRNTLEVTYLPLHTPTATEVADKAAFADGVRADLATHLNVPTTRHSYDDVWLAGKARRYGVEQTFEVASLQAIFSLSADGISQLCARAAARYAEPTSTHAIWGHAHTPPATCPHAVSTRTWRRAGCARVWSAYVVARACIDRASSPVCLVRVAGSSASTSSTPRGTARWGSTSLRAHCASRARRPRGLRGSSPSSTRTGAAPSRTPNSCRRARCARRTRRRRRR